MQRGVLDVLAVEQDPALVRIVETHDQVQHRGLAATGSADQRRHLAGREDEVEMVEHGLVVAVGKRDVVDPDFAGPSRQRLGIGRLFEHQRPVGDLVHQPDADHSLFERDARPRQPLGRLVGKQQRGDEGHDRAGRLPAFDDQIAADQDHSGDRDARQRLHDRAGDGFQRGDAVCPPLDVGHRAVHAVAHRAFQVERLDDARAEHRLLHHPHDHRDREEFLLHDPFGALQELVDGEVSPPVRR